MSEVENIIITKENNDVKLVFPFFNEKFNKRIRVCFNQDEIRDLIRELEGYVGSGDEIRKEDEAYTEEISNYRGEVERTLSLCGKKGSLEIYLNCYTDKPYDDNWIELTPTRLRKLIGLLYGYIK